MQDRCPASSLNGLWGSFHCRSFWTTKHCNHCLIASNLHFRNKEALNQSNALILANKIVEVCLGLHLIHNRGPTYENVDLDVTLNIR